ncbi:MAG: alpha/beta fold hydrolase [Elainellaceae cyanobacterium]
MQTIPYPLTSEPGATWNWRGQSIYYVRAGAAPNPQGDSQNNLKSDRPPLLLVHGFGASTDHWRKNIAQLKDTFEVFAIDLLGFGRSAKPDQIYSGEVWRDQLHDFITEVIGRPAVLAGNSLGGYACLCVAAQRPESAAGLVLLNSAGPFSDAAPVTKSPMAEAWSTLVRSVLRQPWASFLLFQYVRQRSMIRRTLQQVYLDQSAVTEQLIEDIYRPSCDAGAPLVFASVFSSPQGEKVDVLLRQMHCPLLMLWGEGDPWIRARERSVKFREVRPELTEHFLNAGHCPHDEVPEQVNRLLTAWVLEHCTPEKAAIS